MRSGEGLWQLLPGSLSVSRGQLTESMPHNLGLPQDHLPSGPSTSRPPRLLRSQHPGRDTRPQLSKQLTALLNTCAVPESVGVGKSLPRCPPGDLFMGEGATSFAVLLRKFLAKTGLRNLEGRRRMTTSGACDEVDLGQGSRRVGEGGRARKERPRRGEASPGGGSGAEVGR